MVQKLSQASYSRRDATAFLLSVHIHKTLQQAVPSSFSACHVLLLLYQGNNCSNRPREWLKQARSCPGGQGRSFVEPTCSGLTAMLSRRNNMQDANSLKETTSAHAKLANDGRTVPLIQRWCEKDGAKIEWPAHTDTCAR